jgi:hypothetical protein
MHPLDDELELYRTGRLPAGKSATVESHLLECNFCAIRLRRLFKKEQGQNRTDVPERRHHVRIPTDEPASITIVQPSQKLVGGRVLEVSETGLKLAVSKALERGTLIQVRLANRFVLAEVRHCSLHGSVFHVGVAIKNVFEIPGK